MSRGERLSGELASDTPGKLESAVKGTLHWAWARLSSETHDGLEPGREIQAIHLSRGAEVLTVCLRTGREWLSFLPRVSHFLSLAETEDG